MPGKSWRSDWRLLMPDKKQFCQQARFLLMGYLDGELNTQQNTELTKHLQECEACRNELKMFESLKKETGAMNYKELPDVYWQNHWDRIYNRIERGIGWVFLSLGAVLLLSFGAYHLFNDFFLNPEINPMIKAGTGLALFGGIVLFVSVAREKWILQRVDKYRSVQR